MIVAADQKIRRGHPNGLVRERDGANFGFETLVAFPPLRWIVVKRGLGWNVEDAETTVPAEIDGLLQAHIKAHEDAQSVADMLNRMDASKLKLH